MNKKYESTLRKYEKYLNLKGYAENSKKIYIHYISEYLNRCNKPGLHLTIRDSKNYIELYRFTSISQQNQIISAIKAYYHGLLNIDLKDKIFTERPRKQKLLPKVIDNEYLIKKINAIENIKHKAIISLAYSVGLRVSEVINLKICDIDSKRMEIAIRQSKGNKDRIVPLSRNILALLRQYYKEYMPKIYLFNGHNKDKYTASSCNKIVKRYLGSGYHFHLLRHSSFTHLTDKSVDIHAIQKLAGHASSKTTEIYLHMSSNTLQGLPLPI